ncbi:HipA domain-containing protein [Kocuria oceani]|uniref:HipA domain-containing protein n=1 Tax=Kocuria oceani TaxID=988827 RepID=UPI0040362951
MIEVDLEHPLPEWFLLHDVSDWVAVQEEPGGADPKTWLSPPGSPAGVPRQDLWLFKPAKAGIAKRKGGGERRFRKHDDISELVVHRVAIEMGVPTAEIRLVTRDGIPGCVSRDVTPQGWELQSGDTMLSEFEGYLSCAGDERPKNRPGHSLDNIWRLLDGVRGPDGTGEAAAVFAGYLVLDAWVANTDRHAINWAVLLDLTGAASNRLAPSFDHGTAFGSGIADEQLAEQNVCRFCRRGRAARFENGRDRSLVDLALDAVLRAGEDGTRWVDALGAVEPERLQEIVDAVPGMSAARRRFTLEVLTENRRRLTA